MTSFGFLEAGGGTLVPRTLAFELQRRGWDVTVFYAGVHGGRPGVPYDVVTTQEQGVTLVGVFNKDHALLDVGNPRREVDDPLITAAFAKLLDDPRPDVVHFHNLHNLGAALLDEAAARGVRSFYTAHNHWLVCPRAYLLEPDGELCARPGPGAAGGPRPRRRVRRLPGRRRPGGARVPQPRDPRAREPGGHRRARAVRERAPHARLARLPRGRRRRAGAGDARRRDGVGGARPRPRDRPRRIGRTADDRLLRLGLSHQGRPPAPPGRPGRPRPTP